jgi:hypothetical protein
MADVPDKPQELTDEFFILGVTSNGRQFRPSDWAERLCGVMSCYRPEGSGGPNAHLTYSPYVRPTMPTISSSISPRTTTCNWSKPASCPNRVSQNPAK